MKKLLLLTVCSVCAAVTWAQLQAPALTFPANASSIVDVNVRLTWDPSLGGTVSGYDIEVDTDSSFSSPVSYPILGTSAKTSELDFNQVYFWRARGKNSSGNSPWSQARKFSTFYDNFKTLSPSGPNRNPKLKLSWDTVAGVSAYIYELDTDSNFSSPATGQVSQPAPSANDPKGRVDLNNLMFGSKYFWRILAKHAKDQSGWSVVKSFTVLSTISMNGPNDSGTVTPEQKLSCKNTPGVSEYRFAIDATPAFDPASPSFTLLTALDKDFNGVNSASVVIELLNYGQIYYWRIQGVNASGTSSWSATRLMTVVDKVTLKTPADSATGISPKNVSFTWDAILGSEKYEMQYDTLSTFATSTSIITPDETNEIVLTLNHIKISYWRVRAIHTRDTSNWSNVFSVSTKPVGISEISSNYTFRIFPNPAQSEIFIDLSAKQSGNLKFQLYNIVGEKLDEVNYGPVSNNERLKYNIDNLDSGIYMVVLDIDGERVTRRLSVR